MTIFSIDPGSKRTGWAVLTEHEQLLQAGILTGSKGTDPAEFRIAAMCKDLRALLDEWKPDTVLLEWSSGHVGQRRHHGGGAGLAVYGIAIGALWQTAVQWSMSDGRAAVVRCIDENVWTNKVRKEDRTLAVAQHFPQYHVEEDPGGDIADAIGLGLWWAMERALVPF